MAQNLKQCLFVGLLCPVFIYPVEDEYVNLLQTYEQLDQKSFAAWYNIGILYRELGMEGKATCAFVRAQKQAGFVEFYKAAEPIFQMGNALKVYSSKFHFYVYSIPICCYDYILLSLLFLFFWLWYCMIRYARKKRYAYAVLFFLSCVYSAYSIKYDWISSVYAGIIDQQTDCFAGPDSSFVKVGLVKAAEIYKIYKEQNGFCQIKSNGGMCWVASSSLEKV